GIGRLMQSHSQRRSQSAAWSKAGDRHNRAALLVRMRSRKRRRSPESRVGRRRGHRSTTTSSHEADRPGLADLDLVVPFLTYRALTVSAIGPVLPPEGADAPVAGRLAPVDSGVAHAFGGGSRAAAAIGPAVVEPHLEHAV